MVPRYHSVIAGLDPVTHAAAKDTTISMASADAGAQVKPGYDDESAAFGQNENCWQSGAPVCRAD